MDAESFTGNKAQEDLEKLTVPQLKNRCREEGITPVPKIRATLIEALLNRQESADAGAASASSSAATGVSQTLFGLHLGNSDGNSDNEHIADERSSSKHPRVQETPARESKFGYAPCD